MKSIFFADEDTRISKEKGKKTQEGRKTKLYAQFL